MGMALTLRDLHFQWPDGTALFAGIDLDLKPGARLAVIGKNGSGKTTLGRILAGILPPSDASSLSWQEKPLSSWPLVNRVSDIQLVGQRPDLQLSGRAATLRAEVAFGPENLNLPRAEIAQRADEALAAMGLDHLAHRDPRRLSGGESQRLAIAAALAFRPRLLILDEPLTDLDQAARQGLIARLATLSPGLAVIALDIRADEWLAQGFTRFQTLADGKLTQHDATTQGAAAPAPETRKVSAQSYSPLVQIRDLSFAYAADTPLLKGVNLDLPGGAAIAVTGPNGAGKSTLMRLIAGLNRPDQGQITLAGLEVGKVKARVLAGVLGMVFQNADRQFTAASVVGEARLAPRLQRMSEPDLMAQAAVDALGIGAVTHHHPFDLDNGARRLAAVAAALSHGPKVLILDETQRGLDAHHLTLLEQAIRNFCEKGGLVLFVCHDEDFTTRNASHRLAVSGRTAVLSQFS